MNDARNKLRSMGGIMASSPELMQAAAQRFNAGGIAMTTAPTAPLSPAVQYNDMMRPPMEPPVVGLGRVAPVRPAGLPESPVLGAVGEADIVAELMAGSSAINSPSQQSMRDIVSLPEVIVGAVPYRVDVKTKSVFRNDGSPVRGAEAEAALKQAPEALYTSEKATSVAAERRARKKLEANQARLQELQEEKVGGVAPSSAAAEEEVALLEEINALGGELGSFASAEDTVMSMPLTPATEQTFKDLVPKGAQEDPAEAEKIAEDAMDVLLKTQRSSGGGGGDGGGEEDPAKSLEDYYKDARALISKVYGEEDDGVDNRMMDLAMIGLAIAAGTSPNALTNIAQGLAVGAQGISRREQAERERAREQERAKRTLALEMAIARQEAATEAEAEAARMEAEQQNKLAVARIRAGGDTSEKSRAEYRYNAVFDETYKSLINPDPMTGREPISPQQAISLASAAAAAAAPDAPSAQGVPAAQEGTAAGMPVAESKIRKAIELRRSEGRSDAEIRKMLEDRNINPADFGL